MHLIAHRRNTLEQLQTTPTDFGIEVDIRSHGTELIIHHDPFVEGNRFEEWLSHYRHGTLILNVKEEGLEWAVVELLEKYNITNYFFLDQSFPFLVRCSNKGLHQASVRVSEYEHITTALTLAGQVDWVWVDCFTKFPLDKQDSMTLTKAGFKLCLGSPELHFHEPETAIPDLITVLQKEDIVFDAICTKRPDLWAALADNISGNTTEHQSTAA